MKPKSKTNKFFKIVLLTSLVILLGFLLIKNEDGKTDVPSDQAPQVKIEVSGVKVNDFIKNSREESYITIDKTKDYHLFYIPDQELFYISITSYPFDEHVVSAEDKLLVSLGITKEEACKLNVDITTPTYANPEKAGVVYDLSWCE